MPPRRSSVGAKRKFVRTVRPGRKSAATEETPAPEAAAETLPPETTAATDAAAGETTPAADGDTGGCPAPEEITHQAGENPSLGTPAAAESATAGETTAAMEVDATEVAPQASEAPALDTPAAAAETVAGETTTVMEEVKDTAGCPEPEITPQAARKEAAQPADPVPGAGTAEGGDARVVEAAGADEAATGVAEAAPAVKKTTKRVRKVITRRVPVKRIPNKKEPEPAAGKEDKGGEETALRATEGEQNPNGAEAVSVSIEEGNSIGAEAVSMSVKGENPNGAEAVPMLVEGENPSGAEAVSVSVEEQNPLLCPNRPYIPEEPSPHVDAAVSAAPASADGASPVVVPQKRVRKVKKIVVVKRPVKAKGVSQKEEKMEEADGGTVEKVARAEAAGGAVEKVVGKEADGVTVEKVASPGSDANTNEPSKNDKPDLEAEAASVPDRSLRIEEDVVPESHKDDDTEKGVSSRSVDEEQEKIEDGGGAADQMIGLTERQKRRKTEIFIGGLDRNATEDDIRKVFEKVGEIVEVRMMMDKKTGKNKGYAFLRYATPAQAKQAVAEFSKVEVCGKQCGAAALEGNDTIFLGNIDKKWRKDDVAELLHEIGIEKIDTVTLMPDPKNPECNRGFAFLDFETNKDAQTAYKKLQKKDAFGKGRNIKVAWAEPLADPDEEQMQKVKSVFVEGIPSSWDEKKLREHFKRFGQIERVVLSRNMHSAKRKDFAFVNFTTREAALSCVESFDKDSNNNGSKVNVKVSLAKPVQKNKQNKAGMKSSVKDSSKVKPKAVQRETKVNIPVKSQSSRGAHGNIGEEKSSTTRELLHVLREQAAWKQHSYPRGPTAPDYGSDLHGRKRPLSAVGDSATYADPRGYPRARLDSAYPVAVPRLVQGDNARLDSAYPVAGPSYSSMSHGMAGTSLEYYPQSNVRYGTGSVYGAAADAPRTFQVRPGSAPYGGGLHTRCKCRIGTIS